MAFSDVVANFVELSSCSNLSCQMCYRYFCGVFVYMATSHWLLSRNSDKKADCVIESKHLHARTVKLPLTNKMQLR